MLNQVQLIGFTGAEPEIRTVQSGKKVAILRVATSRYTRKGDERREYTTWHTIEVWHQPSVNWLASRALAKGSKVFVQGEVRHDRTSDSEGVERFYSKIVVGLPGHELKSLERPEQNPADEE